MAARHMTDEMPTIMELTARVGQALQSSRDITAILRDIIELVIEIMSADACSIYLYEDRVLKLKASKGVELDAGEEGRTIKLGEGVTGLAGLQQMPIAVRDIEEEKALDVAPLDGFEGFRSMVSVPLLDGDKLVGVMDVFQREVYDYTETEKNFLAFISSQLVGAVRNTQLYEEVVRSFREIATLHQISQIASSVLDLDELLPTIARTCAEHLSARGCVLRLLDTGTGKLEIRGSYGVPDDLFMKSELIPGEGIAGKVLEKGVPLIRSGPAEAGQAVADAPEDVLNSVICVPLSVKKRVIGTLGVFDVATPFSDEPAFFDEDDVELVSMIGGQVAMAIENARLYDEAMRLTQDKDLRIKELSLLLEITNIMRSSLDLEELLYVILTSVTMGPGLGFNRAMLFMLDDKKRTLMGRMAVGPLNPEDASKHWNAIDPEGKTLSELVMEWGQFNMTAGFKIDRIIKNTAIPVEPGKGVLVKTVLKRTTYNVQDYVPPENSEESFLSEVGFTSFATVPLVTKNRVSGLIVVDNMVTRELITEEHVKFLQLFANQAAIAIEMGRMYKNLEMTNRRLIDARDLLVRTKTLATLGEFSAGVAHELRNPLVAIGGFAKRLAKKLEGESREAQYARIIAREVEGMESILNQILEFVGGAGPHFTTVDIPHIIGQVSMLFHDRMRENNINLETKYDRRVRNLRVDEVQMRQLFINLIKNSIEAMKDGGELRITTTYIEEGDGGVGFEIADTGEGIPADDLSHIFDPFFTKKETGTGLGLSMCSRIVETNHGGRIFVDSKVGRGTSVLVWLPQEVLEIAENEEQGTTEE